MEASSNKVFYWQGKAREACLSFRHNMNENLCCPGDVNSSSHVLGRCKIMQKKETEPYYSRDAAYTLNYLSGDQTMLSMTEGHWSQISKT